MKTYYVSIKTQTNEAHNVHVESCKHLPVSVNRAWLGGHPNSGSAIAMAKKYYYPNSEGCKYCCA